MCLLTVPTDHDNLKDVLGVERVHISTYKEANPNDSDDMNDIGLSSEDEAEDLPEVPTIRRKYAAQPSTSQPEQPQPAPEPDQPQATTSVQVPMELLQKVHEAIGGLLAGQDPGSLPGLSSQAGAPTDPTDAPFSLPNPKRGEKECKYCLRKFWATDTLKRHMKVHTGKQKYECGACKRKLVSKRSYDKHLETCGKERRVWCTKKGCNKYFVSQEGLKLHMTTHRKIKKGMEKCACGAEFTKLKSKLDHFRTCDSNPNKVGPFPCPVAGCHRGPVKPFRRIRNLNLHMRVAHAHDPKHGR